MVLIGEFLGSLHGSLMNTGSPLMKNVVTLSAKSVLIPLGLTASASIRDASIQQKIFGSVMTTLIISRKEKHYIIKIVKSIE